MVPACCILHGCLLPSIILLHSYLLIIISGVIGFRVVATQVALITFRLHLLLILCDACTYIHLGLRLGFITVQLCLLMKILFR